MMKITAIVAAVLGSLFFTAPAFSFDVLHSFTGPDGETPAAPLVQGKDGLLYGVAAHGGDFTVLAPDGAERSGNPWHVHEYRAEEFRGLCQRHFGQVDLLGLFHARKLRAHQWAIEHAGWDAIHARLGFTKPFYDRFTPAISVRDFALRRPGLDRALDFLAVLRP